MSLSAVHIEGYRSIESIRFPVEDLTVFVGRNGVGKTNLYRALQLLQAAADGTIGRRIASEGGVASVLWAGPRKRKKPVRLVLEAELDYLAYRIEIGVPRPTDAALSLDPMVKEEEVTARAGGERVAMMKREGPAVWLRDENGRRNRVPEPLLPSETALSAIRDVGQYPELDMIRRHLLDWRFYHQVRTDTESPIRQPHLGVCTPTLSSDASDLAAVLATVYGVREDATDIEDAIEDAFPGSHLSVEDDAGQCRFAMTFPDIRRPFEAHELSDGTLSYLTLVGALCAYRLPAFIALNEPEASLHPDLLPALARLIARAAERTRIWVVTHSEPLAESLAEATRVTPRRIEKEGGATWIEGLSMVGEFRDD